MARHAARGHGVINLLLLVLSCPLQWRRWWWLRWRRLRRRRLRRRRLRWWWQVRFQLAATWYNCTSSLTAQGAPPVLALNPATPPNGSRPSRPSRDGINSTFLPKEDFSNLPKFEKNFYYEHPAVTARTDDDVRLGWQRRHVAAIPCSVLAQAACLSCPRCMPLLTAGAQCAAEPAPIAAVHCW